MALNESISRFVREKKGEHDIDVSYSGKFEPYNANVRRMGRQLTFGLSREWRKVSDEIVLGLLQSLSIKILKLEKTSTTNMDLYHNFIRAVHVSLPKRNTDELLESSFNRVNDAFFSGLIEKPNFKWHKSLRRLASYNYHTDTLSVSEIFRSDLELLDYLVYHELLHKKLKFSSKSCRTLHHSRQFRQLEAAYPQRGRLEAKISRVLRSAR